MLHENHIGTGCGVCPKDDLKREEQALACVHQAINGLEAVSKVYLCSLRDREMFAIYGELLHRKAESKLRIKRLKKAIKEEKANA